MGRNYVAKKIEDMPFSGIRKFFDVAAEMEDVISLGVGEPDFDTPFPIRQEAINILEKGITSYTSNSGLLELRQEIVRYLDTNFNISYDPTDEVLITVGASEGIDIALRAIVNPGDEVLYHEPCYVSYRPCIEMSGAVPVAITTKNENEFRLTAKELLSAITPKTKALLLCYPNNPTGAIMEQQDLAEIVEVLKDKDIIVITDEIYAELTYNNKRHVSIASFPEMKDKTILLSGFSKAFAMTGWRLGYAAGPKDIMQAMLKIHQYIIMCAPTVSQYAGLKGLQECAQDVVNMREEYDKRRKFVVERFRAMGMDCFEPMGAFYVFPSIQSTGMSSEEFCERLLFEEKVAVVPGTAFGACGEGFVRVSYAYSMEELDKALSTIEKFLNKLKK